MTKHTSGAAGNDGNAGNAVRQLCVRPKPDSVIVNFRLAGAMAKSRLGRSWEFGPRLICWRR